MAAGHQRRSPRRAARLLLLALLAAAGFVALIALGIWQVERRAWKLDLIARVEARVDAAPVAAPGLAQWASVSEARDGYRRVRLQGRFLHDRETLVQAATVRGAGFWVLTPMASDRGFTVLVNRGFVPADRKAPGRRAEGQVAGETVVTGLMRMSEPKGGFLRTNEPAAERWYSRDVAAIASARGLGPVAPYFIDADATANAGGYPIGGLTVIRFNNNHLGYALTWFGLAALLALGAGLVVRHELRQGEAEA
uniref:SURF1 family protein n=1 Tax=Edaphosphingomonas laterariae TaxID=861865 RepID=UPI000B776618|nr:SURF1 family protein [Sphingomonas laterariae]